MQKSPSVEKKKILWDGVLEVPGLIRVQELKLTKATIKVPSFKRLRTLSSGNIEIPIIEMVYSNEKGTITQKFWEDFFYNEIVKDAIEIRLDQYGNETQRRLWQMCECIDNVTPEYNAEAPVLQTITVQIAPWDIIPIY